MEQRIITVYCLIDEYLKAIGVKDDMRASVSNAEVLLVGYIAVSDFAGNYRKAHQYFSLMQCCKMLEYSRFIFFNFSFIGVIKFERLFSNYYFIFFYID